MSIGSTIEGTTGNLNNVLGPDYDDFKFDATAGDHLRVTIANRAGGTFQASGLVVTPAPAPDTYRVIRPGTSDTPIATREFYIAESGEYGLFVSDLRNLGAAPQEVGGPTLTYRAEISRVSRAPAPLTPPVVHHAGNIPNTGDVTAASFTATMGQRITAPTRAIQLPTPSKVDTYLLLFDASTTPPTLVQLNDDQGGPVGTDSLIDVIAPTNGSYLLVVDHYDVRGITPDDRKWEVPLGTGLPCLNGILDHDESDVDCGGATCAACALTKSCNPDGDCAAGSCKSDHSCGCPSALHVVAATVRAAFTYTLVASPSPAL